MNGTTSPGVLQPLQPHATLPLHGGSPLAAMTASPERHGFHTPTPDSKRDWILICDACERQIDIASDQNRLQCTGCDYDLCGSCISRSECPPKQPLRCPAGHILMIRAPGPHQHVWMCDSCGHKSGPVCEGGCFRCAQCDYDLCSACVARSRSPMPTGPRCPKGHLLKKPGANMLGRLQSCATPEKTQGCRLRSGLSTVARECIGAKQPSQSAPGSLAIPACIAPKSYHDMV